MFREAYLLHHALRRAQQRLQNLGACRAPLLAPARTAHVKAGSIPVSPHELRHQRRLRRVRCAAPVFRAACQPCSKGEKRQPTNSARFSSQFCVDVLVMWSWSEWGRSACSQRRCGNLWQ